MRIKAIGLSWFRGAADAISLEPNSKSVVVYGENGSGKSSFVDAVEYVLNHGKIGHLSHEYSGKNQEKAIVNTHTPDGKKTELRIKFQDESELITEIKRNGSSISSGAESVAMGSWDYQHTVLRQDEVAAFIRDTKGGKYSALLPLLGLNQIEVAAENLRQLAKSIDQQAKPKETKLALEGVEAKKKTAFGTSTDKQVLDKIEQFHTKYCADKTTTVDPITRCKELDATLKSRIASFSADQKRHIALKDTAGLDLRKHVKAVRSTSLMLADKTEPPIAEKLEVLESAGVFADTLGKGKEVSCPACGRSIEIEAFRTHIDAEKKRLQEIIATFNARKTAIREMCDTIKSLKASLGKTDIKPWRDELAKGALAGNFTYLNELKVESILTSCVEEDLKNIEVNLFPLIDAAMETSEDAPPDVQQLATDKNAIEVGKAVVEHMDKADAAACAEILISFICTLEQGVREEIRLQSQKVIGEISTDIRDMWEILHPGEAIENIHLYVPDDTNKAIDIALKFHGVEQDSPRLTLSEGFRNSLGLCIFLAMAKRDTDKDQPLFLDDVVVSLDRNHRGMIVDLLEKKFADRQVVLLTHDRDWYTELRHRLDGKSWSFKVLMPWENPVIGIRWSALTSTFDDARARLKDAPDSAGNTTRKIMDIELAIRAECIKIKLPYLHRERNDHRTAHDFLTQLISDGEECFKKKGEKNYEPYSEAIVAFREADKLLLTWGNKASHSFDLDKKEAQKLIEACETALEHFNCTTCKKLVYKLTDAAAKFVQCECGFLRWQ